MGNVYTRDIKRLAETLYEKFKDQIELDFSKNKELVKKYVDVNSKKLEIE
jgi:small subunit ribosomal protein S17e